MQQLGRVFLSDFCPPDQPKGLMRGELNRTNETNPDLFDGAHVHIDPNQQKAPAFSKATDRPAVQVTDSFAFIHFQTSLP
jgi:hypothetical protein